MKHQLNIEEQEAQLEKCAKILDMIKSNRKYMLSKVSESSSRLYVRLHGKAYYENKIADMANIQKRLICYYAKQVAKLASEPYEVAMEIKEPKQARTETSNL